MRGKRKKCPVCGKAMTELDSAIVNMDIGYGYRDYLRTYYYCGDCKLECGITFYYEEPHYYDEAPWAEEE